MNRLLASVLIVSAVYLTGCGNAPPVSTAMPSGIEATGSAGQAGGAARAPAGSGVIGVTRPQ